MEFFRNTCKLEAVYKDGHGRVKARFDPTKFYFITVRHPVGQYVSLFRFGLDRKGALFQRLNKSGLADDLYREGNEGFNRWLAYILDPANAKTVEPPYRLAAHLGIGLQSYRFLSFALRRSQKVFQEAKDYDDLVARFRTGSILNHVIRNENLSEGLRHLATELFPQHFDQDKVAGFLAASTRVNAAKSSSAALYEPLGEIRDLLEEKEKFLLREFYS
jgi:hypothetical protein